MKRQNTKTITQKEEQKTEVKNEITIKVEKQILNKRSNSAAIEGKKVHLQGSSSSEEVSSVEDSSVSSSEEISESNKLGQPTLPIPGNTIKRYKTDQVNNTVNEGVADTVLGKREREDQLDQSQLPSKRLKIEVPPQSWVKTVSAGQAVTTTTQEQGQTVVGKFTAAEAAKKTIQEQSGAQSGVGPSKS